MRRQRDDGIVLLGAVEERSRPQTLAHPTRVDVTDRELDRADLPSTPTTTPTRPTHPRRVRTRLQRSGHSSLKLHTPTVNQTGGRPPSPTPITLTSGRPTNRSHIRVGSVINRGSSDSGCVRHTQIRGAPARARGPSSYLNSRPGPKRRLCHTVRASGATSPRQS